MFKKLFYLVFLFLLMISCVAASISSTATVNIENSPVKFQLVTTSINGDSVIIKAKISDSNGYEDIENVEFNMEFNNEIIAEGNLNLDEGVGVEALYISSAKLGTDEGIYSVNIKAKDGETTSEWKTEFEYPQEKGTLTGAFIQGPENGDGILTRFFNWLRDIFS